MLFRSERPEKIKPILSIEDREMVLLSLKYINNVITYTTEQELLEILKSGKYQIRFLGDDYINSNYTGKGLDIEIFFIDRSHGWSTTKFKKLISTNEIYEKNNILHTK